MKLLTTIVAFLSISSTSAAGWGHPQRKHVSIVQANTATATLENLTARSKATAAVNKALSRKKQEGALGTRGGEDKFRDFQNAAKIHFRKRIGDIGNVATIFLSAWLLVESLKVMGNNQVQCTYGEGGGTNSYPCTPKEQVDSFLDPCYVCDAFCTSRRESNKWNSHMTSVYVDLFMTAMIFVLRKVRCKELKRLKLDDYFLSNLKMTSVAGHGAAHWFLSFLMTKQFVGLGTAGLSILLGLMLGTALISQEQLWKLKSRFGYSTGDYSLASVEDKQTHEMHTERVNLLGIFLAPFGMLQGMTASAASNSAVNPGGVLIFAAAACLFFNAGAPPTIPLLYAIVGAIALTVISIIFVPPNDVEDDFGPGFTLIFSSAYIYSSLTQLFFWPEKKDFELQEATSYAFNSWVTALLTTCVGWALGLKCTPLIKWGGHALYDFSIPLSYFILYLLVKKFEVKEN